MLLLTAILLAQASAVTPAGPAASWTAEVAIATGLGEIDEPYFGSGPEEPLRLWFVSLRPVRRLVRLGPLQLDYTPELMQLSVVARTPTYRGSWFSSGGGSDSIYAIFPWGTTTVWGAGTAPAALRTTFHLLRSAALYGEAAGGIAWFAHEVPDRGAGQVQLQLIVGAGIRLSLGRGYQAVLGYRHHHLSNGGLTDDNAALNTHLLQVAVTLP